MGKYDRVQKTKYFDRGECHSINDYQIRIIIRCESSSINSLVMSVSGSVDNKHYST